MAIGAGLAWVSATRIDEANAVGLLRGCTGKTGSVEKAPAVLALRTVIASGLTVVNGQNTVAALVPAVMATRADPTSTAEVREMRFAAVKGSSGTATSVPIAGMMVIGHKWVRTAASDQWGGIRGPRIVAA